MGKGWAPPAYRSRKCTNCAQRADGKPFNILYEITPIPIPGSDSHEVDGSFKVISMEKEEQTSLMYHYRFGKGECFMDEASQALSEGIVPAFYMSRFPGLF